MPKSRLIKTNFSAGELSPEAYGRVTLERYADGAKRLFNFLLMPLGSIRKREGTRFVYGTKDNAFTVLVDFEYNKEQAYQLAFSDGCIRFFRNRSILLDGVSPYEVATTYSEDELEDIVWAQSADVLYLVHPDHPPRKLSRQGATSWTLEEVSFVDGPYFNTNEAETTFTLGASSGSGVTLTASSIVGINGGAGFQTTDIGRHVRVASDGKDATRTGWISNVTDSGGEFLITSSGHNLSTGQVVKISNVSGTGEANGTWVIQRVSSSTFKLTGSTFAGSYTSGGQWETSALVGWGTIVSRSSTTVVTVDIHDPMPASASKNWRLGAFSGTTGYPSVCFFHEQRFCLAATASQEQTMWMSRSDSYESFSPTELDQIVLDDNAIEWTIGVGSVHKILWGRAGSSLLVGTAGGEFKVTAGANGGALTPNNVTVVPQDYEGSAPGIRAQTSGSSVLFVPASKASLSQLQYNYEVDGFEVSSLSILSEHLFIRNGGIRATAFQRKPHSVWWALTKAGNLVGMTFLKKEGVIGFHQHQLGGEFLGLNDQVRGRIASTKPIVESISVIPKSDGSVDELWMVVKRTINGSIVRYIEFMEDPFNPVDVQDKENMFFVDCGLSYNNPWRITGITQASTAVVTLASDSPADLTAELSTGDFVRVDDVLGMVEVSNLRYKVGTVTTHTLELLDFSTGLAVNSSSYSPYVAGGSLRKMVNAVSGLEHLEGSTVVPVIDGAVHPETVVDAGAIALQKHGGIVHVGFPYSAEFLPLEPEGGAALGSSQGVNKRVNRLYVRVVDTVGGQYSDSLSGKGRSLKERQLSSPMDQSPDLFTGDCEVNLESSFFDKGAFALMQKDPYPLKIAAITQEQLVNG